MKVKPFLVSILIVPSALSYAQKAQKANQYYNGQPVYTQVDEMPDFPGDLSKYLLQHMRNVDFNSSPQKDFQGSFLFSFLVDTTGHLQRIEILKGKADLKDEASLIRVFTSMPKWKPGKLNGKKVLVLFKLPMCVDPGY